MSQTTQFFKGFFVTFVLLSAISAAIGAWYASEVDMGGRDIRWMTGPYSGGKPPFEVQSDHLIYKEVLDAGYAFTVSCAFLSVGTVCNSDYCYANKPTADKKCVDNSYDFASGWLYIPNCKPSATGWIGSSWYNYTATDTNAPAPMGGGTRGVCGASGDTNYISYIYCCRA